MRRVSLHLDSVVKQVATLNWFSPQMKGKCNTYWPWLLQLLYLRVVIAEVLSWYDVEDVGEGVNVLPSTEQQLNQTEDKSSHFSSFLTI